LKLEALVAPHPESAGLVEWLGIFGVDEDNLARSPASDWVTLKVPVSLAEKMLDTAYAPFQHKITSKYLKGEAILIGGTSASTPTFTGIVSFIERCSSESRFTTVYHPWVS